MQDTIKKEKKANSLYVIKIDRGYIEYSEFYSETGETQYGVVLDIKYAKLFSNSQATRIVSKFKKKGEYAEKVAVEEKIEYGKKY